MAEFGGGFEEKQSVLKAVSKLEQIRDELREVNANLHDQIESIESDSLQKLRFAAEVKASSLEVEVQQLREELKVIKEFLGTNLEKKKPKEN